MQVIVHTVEGRAVVTAPENPDIDLAELAAMIIAPGSTFVIVEKATLPATHPKYWSLVNGAVVSNDAAAALDTQLRLALLVKAECKRRIYAVATATTQINMVATAAADIMPPAQVSSLQAALAWIAAMRSASRGLITANDQDYKNDAKWPIVPAAVVAICAIF